MQQEIQCRLRGLSVAGMIEMDVSRPMPFRMTVAPNPLVKPQLCNVTMGIHDVG